MISLYNEAGNLATLATSLNRLVAEGVELIIVDNGSSDDTGTVAAELIAGAKLIRVLDNQGLGSGLKVGLEQASGTYVGWLPGNGKVEPLDILPLLELAEREGIAVKALRSGRPLGARIKTALSAVAQSLAVGMRVRDTGGTPTVIPARMVPAMLEGPDGYAFETFSLIVAKRSGVHVRRVPVQLGNRKNGESHWQRGLRSELRLLMNLLRHARSWR